MIDDFSTACDAYTLFEDFKKLHQQLEEEEENEFMLLEPEIQTNNDFAETNGLAYLGGHMLKHTILLNSKCITCTKAFTVGVEEDQQECNALITEKEFKSGALTRPSVLANALFKRADKLFKANRQNIEKQKKQRWEKE